MELYSNLLRLAFLPLSIIPLGSIQVVAQINNPFLLLSSIPKTMVHIWIYQSLSIHALKDIWVLPVFGDYKKSHENFPQCSFALSMKVWPWERSLHVFLSSGTTKLVGVCSWEAQALGVGERLRHRGTSNSLRTDCSPNYGFAQSKPRSAPVDQILVSYMYSLYNPNL